MKNRFLYALLIPLFLGISCTKKELTREYFEDKNSKSGSPVEQKALLTYEPHFPSGSEELTFVVDLEQGNGALRGASEVFVHIGVITNKSTNDTDWKYVKNGWEVAVENTRLTPKEDSKFEFKLNPREFLQVPAGEVILKLAMVFKNASGDIVGRNADGSDIYLPFFESNKLNVRFLNPEMEPLSEPRPIIKISDVGQELLIDGVSSKKATLSLKINGDLITSVSNSETLQAKYKVEQAGNYEVILEANDGSETSSAVFYFVINSDVVVEALPIEAKEGVVLLNGGTSALITLYAPKKQNVYLIGDFNDWRPSSEYFMKKTPDGNFWWIRLDNLELNKEYGYQFKIDGNIAVADPYTEKILDPYNDQYISTATYPNLKSYPSGKTTGTVSVFNTKADDFSWTSGTFTRPQKNDLVIYELLVRDFHEKRNYEALIEKIGYFKDLGINAIELMPVNEFEGNSSWGYNPSFYFAADKYYGTKKALKEFIDVCHKNGIAVVIDMVLNHSFGESPMVKMYFDAINSKPNAQNIWFNQDATHPYNVGYDFNHESSDTRRFVKNVVKFWIEEYKIDGFRFDLSKGFTQKNTGSNVGEWSKYDASRIAIWKDYNNYIKSIAGNDFYVILEHFAEDSEEKELAAEGMMLWNNLNHNFSQASMGHINESSFDRAFHTSHGFASSENLVTYMESHDEERMMYRNLQYGKTSGSYNVKNLATALKRQEMAMAFLMAVPGPKMLWQFGELGYDIEIDRNGRTGEKPILWNYFGDTNRKALYNNFSKFIKMKTSNEVISRTNYITQHTGGAIKQIILTSATNKMVVYGNFDVTQQSATIDFPEQGEWINYLTKQRVNATYNYPVTLQPGEYYILSKKEMN
ncbi:alpha-amylase family glycosyl hydrolase [Pseudopedobacter beijingensis]|uniref:Alpha-amylase family glycosyl hydrolase n=1 Tax=Pseudopedobacter beijingensis TaxID=1207056 RepID=A0ABW4I7K8_9SPHI